MRTASLLICLVMLGAGAFSGCILPDGSDVEITDDTNQKHFCGVRDYNLISDDGGWICRALPEFSLLNNDGVRFGMECTSGTVDELHNGGEIRHCNLYNQTSGEKIEMDWVAYFSAPWCTHCETTLDAYDRAMFPEIMLIFNIDSNEEFSNMSEWKETAEQRLNRSIDRPFIHAPELATEMNVSGIPTVLFIDSHGMIIDFTLGEQTDVHELERKWGDLTGREMSHYDDLD